MKKNLPKLTTYCLLLTAIFLLSGCSLFKKPAINSDLPVASPTPTPQETQLPPDQRPLITMTPDKNVHEVTLKIEKLPADVTTVDYELVYQAGELQRGAIGSYNVSKGSAKITLGSCSSGTCKYDQNISNGMLTIKYRTNGQRVLLREPLKL